LNAATTVNSLRLAAGGCASCTGPLVLTSGNVLAVADGALNLPVNLTRAAAVRVTGTSTLTLGGVLTFGGTSYGLMKAGTGTLLVAAAQTTTSLTQIDGGTLRAAAANVSSPNSSVTITQGTLDLNGFDQAVGTLQTAGGLPAATTVPDAVVSVGAATLTVGSDNATGTFNGVVGGSGTLIKAGTGTKTLAGASTLTGVVRIRAGTLALGQLSALAGVNRIDIGEAGTTVGATLTLPALGVAGTFSTPINLPVPGSGGRGRWPPGVGVLSYPGSAPGWPGCRS
jgi:autotransporter-associated beta strand protein